MKLLALAFGNLATTIAQNRGHEQDDGILSGHIQQVMTLAQPPIGATEAERTTAGVKVLAAINEYLATLSSEETFVLGSFLDDVEDVTGAISRVVLRDLRRRADAGDAFAESKLQRVPPFEVHVIDLSNIMGRAAGAEQPSHPH